MIENLLGNLDGLAEKLGLPADQVQGLVDSVKGKLAGGGDPMSALMQAAGEHGLPTDQISGLLGKIGVDPSALLGKLDSDGDGNPLNDLAGMAKGLFS